MTTNVKYFQLNTREQSYAFVREDKPNINELEIFYTIHINQTVYFCNHKKAHFITSETNISIEPKEKKNAELYPHQRPFIRISKSPSTTTTSS